MKARDNTGKHVYIPACAQIETRGCIRAERWNRGQKISADSHSPSPQPQPPAETNEL